MTARIADRYLIERVVGEGGMGLVYLVTDALRDGRRLALKQIRAERLSVNVRAAMRREFSVLTRLRHPNLVEVYDFSLEPDCWFTMEYVEGNDLRQASLGGDELIDAMVQVLRALEYVHSRGLVHLDVKPSNILVTRGAAGELAVKLMDFGVASDSRAGAPSGYTVGFVAPEVHDGRPFDGRADLYSLGMTVVSLHAAAHSPSSDVTLQVRNIEHGEPPPAPDTSHLPPALAQVAQRLVRLDPSERFGSAAQVIEALSLASGRRYDVETAATRAGYLHSARLTGRDLERDTLEALYTQVAGGAGRHVLVEGPAGVGKSRLVKELRVTAQLDGALVATAACAVEAPSHAAVAAIVAQLGPAARALKPHHAAALARLTASGAQRPRDGDLGSEAARSRLTEAVVAVCAAAARGRPVIITVEDIDWIDDASAHIVLALRARIAAGELRAVFLVLTAREGGAFDNPQRLRLCELSDEGVRDIIDDVLGAGAAPDLLYRRAAELSRGNIFFVTELLKLLADRDILRRTGEPGWSCDEAALAAAELPASAPELVAERVRLLDAPLRRVLWMGAMLGLSFEPAAVEAAAPEGARALLDELVGRLFIGAEGRSFRFAHGVVRDAVLTDARGGGEWAELHRRLGEGLAAAGGHPADVARLFLESDRREQALPHLAAAAALAEAVHDHATAVHGYDQALALVDTRGPAARELHLSRLAAIRAGGLGEADLRGDEALAATAGDDAAGAQARLELARIAARRGRFADAVTAAAEVLSRAERLGDRKTAAEAHRTAGLARLSLGELPAARAELDAAVADYGRVGDVAGHAGALNDRGFVHGYAGDFAAALVDHEDALAKLRRLPPGVALDALAATENNLGFAAWNLGRYDVARGHLDEALSLRRRLSDLHGEGVTRNNLGNVLRHQGDLEGASAEYQTAVELCRRSGNVLYEAIALNNLGQIEEEGGRLGRAEELYRVALERVVAIGDRIREGDNLGNLGICLLRGGRAADAVSYLRRAVEVRRAIGDRAYLVLDLSYLALAELALEERAAARAAVEEAIEVVDAGQEGTEQLQAVFLNGYKVYRALGDRGRARVLLGRAEAVLAARLATINDAAARAAFLERLSVNREIVEACREEDGRR